MHETDEDLKALQRILDESDSKAGDHLRFIFTTERRLDAEGIVAELRRVFVLHLATVTASCEPTVYAVGEDVCIMAHGVARR